VGCSRAAGGRGLLVFEEEVCVRGCGDSIARFRSLGLVVLGGGGVWWWVRCGGGAVVKSPGVSGINPVGRGRRVGMDIRCRVLVRSVAPCSLLRAGALRTQLGVARFLGSSEGYVSPWGGPGKIRRASSAPVLCWVFRGVGLWSGRDVATLLVGGGFGAGGGGGGGGWVFSLRTGPARPGRGSE